MLEKVLFAVSVILIIAAVALDATGHLAPLSLGAMLFGILGCNVVVYASRNDKARQLRRVNKELFETKAEMDRRQVIREL
jgi:hypothetical protein